MPMEIQEIRDPTTNLRGDLLAGIAGQNSGSWSDISGRDKFSIHIVIGGVASVQVRGHNAPAPLDSDDGIDLVAVGLTNLAVGSNTITSSQMVTLKAPFHWIKLKVTAYTNGSLNGYIEGV